MCYNAISKECHHQRDTDRWRLPNVAYMSVGLRTASLNVLLGSINPESLIHLELEPLHIDRR